MTLPVFDPVPAADFLTTVGFAAAAALMLLGVIALLAGVHAMWRLRPLGSTIRFLAGLLLLVSGGLLALVGFGIQGYQALTHESLAATIMVRPVGAQQFEARVRLPDGQEEAYQVSGDEIYVDARILKWKAVGNLVGLNTVYELDRLAGRYRGIAQERESARTVHALGADRPVDLFDLRMRHIALAPLVDAEYGSAAFVPVSRPMRLELRVSTTGLLLREVPLEEVKLPPR